MAGLKDGDKITKINGKPTTGMSYDEFCNEIIISQQQQQLNKHNMIHLMVMRKSNKTGVQKQPVVESPTSFSSSNITTTNTNTNTSIPIQTSSNLVSVIKVTSPTNIIEASLVDGKKRFNLTAT
jgi:hypothetical protein